MKRNLVLAVVSGVLLALAMPKPGIAPLAWVALVPLLIALRRARWTAALACGLAAGLVYFGVILFWVRLFGYLPWVLLSIVQAAYYAIFGLVASRVLPSRIGWWGYVAVPAAWTAMQWSRTLTIYGFPWGGLAHIQAENVAVIQMASVTGVWGIESVVCLFNVAIAQTVFPHDGRRQIARAAALCAVVVGVQICVGSLIGPPSEISDAPRVAVIQPNLPHDVVVGRDYTPTALLVCARMSKSAAEEGAELIVWPESALPTDILEPGYGGVVATLAKRTGRDFLVGGYDPSQDHRLAGSYNAAHLYLGTGRRAGVYRKVHLVPFGEFVPLRRQLPFLANYGIREEDVLPGSSHLLLGSRFGKLGVSICFESLFPEIARLETRNGAELLVVMTNDSWFGRTQVARQHLMMSRLRAVENRRYLVRAALTGISAIIDDYGRIVAEKPIFTRGIVGGGVVPRRGLSPFTRFGPYLAYVSALIALGSLLLGRQAERSRRAGRKTRPHRPLD